VKRKLMVIVEHIHVRHYYHSYILTYIMLSGAHRACAHVRQWRWWFEHIGNLSGANQSLFQSIFSKANHTIVIIFICSYVHSRHYISKWNDTTDRFQDKLIYLLKILLLILWQSFIYVIKSNLDRFENWGIFATLCKI
jgi:hypothetical protein